MDNMQRGSTTGQTPANVNPGPTTVPFGEPDKVRPPRGLGRASDPLGERPDPDRPADPPEAGQDTGGRGDSSSE